MHMHYSGRSITQVAAAFKVFYFEAESHFKDNVDEMKPVFRDSPFNLRLVLPDLSSDTAWRPESTPHIFSVGPNVSAAITSAMTKALAQESQVNDLLACLSDND